MRSLLIALTVGNAALAIKECAEGSYGAAVFHLTIAVWTGFEWLEGTDD